LKKEKFVGIRYDVQKAAITHWTFYAHNMDNAYDQYSKYIVTLVSNKQYTPEEYFLFGNDRLLLSSEEVSTVSDGTNITEAVVGYAFNSRIYTPEIGNDTWMITQNKTDGKINVTLCDKSCINNFD
jgi:hypothetical protein